MGLEKRSGGDKNYLHVIGGQLTRKVDESTPGAESRENKNGKTVWELRYDVLTGCVYQDLLFEDSDYGEQIKLEVMSDGELYVISVPLESRYGNSLMWKLPFIDVEKKFDIQPYDFEPEPGKKLAGFSIKQGGQKVESDYDAENVVPPVDITTDRKGNQKFDYSKRQDWLAEKLEEWADKVDPMSVEKKASEPAAEPSIKEKVIADSKAKSADLDDIDDDLPF